MSGGLLVVRIVVGIVFMAHGSQKLFGWFGSDGLTGTAAMFDRRGLGPGRVTAPVGGTAELTGGASLALGFLTGFGAIAALLMMVGAVVAVHARNGLWNTDGGSEFPIVLGAIALALTFTGPGRWSVDHLAGFHLSGVWWALGACLAALIATAFDVALIRAHRMEVSPAQSAEGPEERGHRDVA